MLDFTPQAFRLFYEFFDHRSLPKHCEDWVQAFIDNRNLMLNVPPRHMKSSIFTKWVPIWLLCINRDELIIIVSQTGKLARLWAADIAAELEFGEVPRVFGRFAPEQKGDTPWRPASGELLVIGRTKERKGQQFSIFARGERQAILGHEATVVIADDPTNAKIAKSEVYNADQMEWFREQVLSRIENPVLGGAAGRAVVVGQRVHYNDMYGQIADMKWERGPKMGQSLWTVITQPAVIHWPDEEDDSDAVVLWPDKWNFTELMLQQARVGGSQAFETMFQQDPMPAGSSIVRPEWWDRCRDYDRAGGDGVRYIQDGGYLPVSRVVSLDPSPKMYNGLVVADVVYDRDRFQAWIIETKKFKAPLLKDLLAEVERCVDMYRPDYLVIEFSTFSDWMKEDPVYQRMKSKVRIMPHSTGRNKGDEVLGTEALGGDVEMGNIHLPYGSKWGEEMSKSLEAEFNTYPHRDYDQLMALWFIKWNWRRFIPANAYSTTGGMSKNVPPRLAGGFVWARPTKTG